MIMMITIFKNATDNLTYQPTGGQVVSSESAAKSQNNENNVRYWDIDGNDDDYEKYRSSQKAPNTINNSRTVILLCLICVSILAFW